MGSKEMTPDPVLNPKVVVFSLLLIAPLAINAVSPAPSPLPPLPSPGQLAWQQNNLAIFLRLGLNTFTGEEQPTGKEDPRLFNPARLDARQWVNAAKNCGAKRLILQVKGHEGFCLWPTKTTAYSVKSSPWRGGAGDVVKEFTDACRQAGLETGFYLSCEDRNHPAFGTPEYNTVYVTQLTELLSNYGPWSEVRLDNVGGEGVGAAPSATEESSARQQVYDWPKYIATIKRLQPKVVIVSIAGPDARWNGNNNGHSGEPNWAIADPRLFPTPEPKDRKQLNKLNFGDENGTVWLPAECVVPLRPHWFWTAQDDTNVMPLDKAFNTWCKSVGRGNVLLWSVPINTDGLVPNRDAERLHNLQDYAAKSLRFDIAAGKAAIAGNTRGGDTAFAPARALDNDPNTFWATDDGVTNECWLEVDLGKPARFSISALREPLSFGQRVATYRIEYEQAGKWELAIHGTTIGQLKIERFKPITAQKVRLVIEKARGCPLISQFSLYDN